ncbi:MAG: uracil phosphoribosyltransferase, partial [Vicinamibacterales bacterium]
MPLHFVEHPLVHDALMELRDARTAPPAFRRAANRISVLLATEALRDVTSVAAVVETPLGPAHGRRVTADVVVVPVLRAGLGMVEGFLRLLADA